MYSLIIINQLTKNYITIKKSQFGIVNHCIIYTIGYLLASKENDDIWYLKECIHKYTKLYQGFNGKLVYDQSINYYY